MRQRPSHQLALSLGIPLLFLGMSHAQATLCDVNMEKAYQEAQQRGWQFNCRVSARNSQSAFGATSVVNFDSQKRLGCNGKTGWRGGSTSRYTFSASFFRKNSGSSSSLMNGWSIDSYQVIGGDYQQKTPKKRVRMLFTWSSTKANSNSRRHLSKIVFKKHAGNCNRLFIEAFG